MSVEEIPSISRLRWLCRRGMKELDVLMVRYLDQVYGEAPEAQRAAFASLLQNVEDPDIWAWVMGHAEPPSEYADVIAALLGRR